MQIRSFIFIFQIGALVCLSGCGSKEAESVDVPPPSAPPAVTAAPPVPTTPAVTPDAPPPNTTGAPIIPAVEEAEVKIADAEGKPMPLLDFMNAAVENYERTRASMTEDNPWPPLTSLDVMVKVGFMKRLPTPPAGQKFHLNTETMKVTLVSQ